MGRWGSREIIIYGSRPGAEDGNDSRYADFDHFPASRKSFPNSISTKGANGRRASGVFFRCIQHDYHRKLEVFLNSVLFFDVLVDGKENVEVRTRLSKELSVSQISPAHLRRCFHIMSWKLTSKGLWDIMVKENSHALGSSSRRPQRASSMTAIACSRVMPSKSSRKWSSVYPDSR